VRLRKLDLAPSEECLQILLDSLLGMEGNDVPERVFGRQADYCVEVEIGFPDLVRNQPADLLFRWLHRGPCRTCAPDKRCRR
jgi:hypothetical protein